MIKLLLEKNVDVNAGTTAILSDVTNGDKNVIAEYLLENTNVDINRKNSIGRTALCNAVKNGNNKLVARLLDKGADINIPDYSGNTALTWASAKGNIEVLIMLLQKNPMLDPMTGENATPVIYAARAGHLDVMKELLSRGAKIDVVTIDGESLLSRSYTAQNKPMMHLLLNDYHAAYTAKDLDNDFLRENVCVMISNKLDTQTSFKPNGCEEVLLKYLLNMRLEGKMLTPNEIRICDKAEQLLKMDNTHDISLPSTAGANKLGMFVKKPARPESETKIVPRPAQGRDNSDK
jgi:ankyrin repeat protein